MKISNLSYTEFPLYWRSKVITSNHLCTRAGPPQNAPKTPRSQTKLMEASSCECLVIANHSCRGEGENNIGCRTSKFGYDARWFLSCRDFGSAVAIAGRYSSKPCDVEVNPEKRQGSQSLKLCSKTTLSCMAKRNDLWWNHLLHQPYHTSFKLHLCSWHEFHAPIIPRDSNTSPYLKSFNLKEIQNSPWNHKSFCWTHSSTILLTD